MAFLWGPGHGRRGTVTRALELNGGDDAGGGVGGGVGRRGHDAEGGPLAGMAAMLRREDRDGCHRIFSCS